VAQGVVEEKATRIIEILLATVPPSRLLAGKIIGIGLVGLLQLAIIAAVALVLVTVTNVVSIPTFTLAAILGYLMWFTLGFLLYATAYAAGGAGNHRDFAFEFVHCVLPLRLGFEPGGAIRLSDSEH